MTITRLNETAQTTAIAISGHKGPLAMLTISSHSSRGLRGFVVRANELGRQYLPSFWQWWLQVMLCQRRRLTVARDYGGLTILLSKDGNRDLESLRLFIIDQARRLRVYAPSQLPLERRKPHELPNATTPAEWRFTRDDPHWYRPIGALAKAKFGLPSDIRFFWWTSEQMYNGDVPIFDRTPVTALRTSGTSRAWSDPYTGALLLFPRRIKMLERQELAERVEYSFFRAFCRENR